MGKPHPVALRERAVSLVAQGNTHTETARRLCVSIKFVNDMVRLWRETRVSDLLLWLPPVMQEAFDLVGV